MGAGLAFNLSPILKRRPKSIDFSRPFTSVGHDLWTAFYQVSGTTSENTPANEPFPSPELLRTLENTRPSSAQQIIETAEQIAKTRQHIEHQRGRSETVGLYTAFIISIFVLIAGTIIALHNEAGIILILADIAALTAAAVYRNNNIVEA